MGKRRKKQNNHWLRTLFIVGISSLGVVYLYNHLQGKQDTDLHAQTREEKQSTGLEIPVSQTSRNQQIVRHKAITLSYSFFHRTPYWVAWKLTRERTKGDITRKSNFQPDPKLPEPRVQSSDYSRSGYDRGHMAPAGDMKWDEQAMTESFYMSNVCPQNKKLNKDDWRDLEEACRRWANKYGRVYIVCGPIYENNKPKRIGKNKVAVPDKFYKVILIDKKQPLALGFVFKNEGHHRHLSQYMVSVDNVEDITGLDFFSLLEDEIENEIEKTIPPLP